MYFQIVHIIVIIYEISNVKIALNIILIGLVSKFRWYKVFQILYLTHHKLSEGFDGFIFLYVKVFNTLLYVYVKNCNLDFGQTNCLLYHVILPCEWIKVEVKKNLGPILKQKTISLLIFPLCWNFPHIFNLIPCFGETNCVCE